MERLILALALVAVVFFGVDKFVLAPGREAVRLAATADANARVEEIAPSIAVLAFADLSPDQGQAYFSDGMAEEILSALSRIKGLKVAGRSSSFYYKGRNESPRAIGEALDVAHLLEGSVRTQGDSVRITAALIATADGKQRWTETYDGDLGNIFDLQERIARDIATELDIALNRSADQRLVEVATDNPEAYAKFIQAQALVANRVGDSLPRAIALLKEATALDPRFSRAWAKLAVAHAVVVQYAGGDWQENWAASDAAAHRAIELNPASAEAHAVLGYNHLSRREYAAMTAPARESMRLDPEDITANFWAANQLASMGRTSDALALIERAQVRDPADRLMMFYKGFLLWALNQPEQALEFSRSAYSLGFSPAGVVLAYEQARQGRPQGGARDYATALSGMGTSIPEAELEAIFLGGYLGGEHRDRALALLEPHLNDGWAPSLLVMLGEPERSFAAFENNPGGVSDGYFTWLWSPEPWSKKARQHPGFQGFAKRIGLLDYWRTNGWPDLCQPVPAQGPDAFTCQ
jgi:TolB-like protein